MPSETAPISAPDPISRTIQKRHDASPVHERPAAEGEAGTTTQRSTIRLCIGYVNVSKRTLLGYRGGMPTTEMKSTRRREATRERLLDAARDVLASEWNSGRDSRGRSVSGAGFTRGASLLQLRDQGRPRTRPVQAGEGPHAGVECRPRSISNSERQPKTDAETTPGGARPIPRKPADRPYVVPGAPGVRDPWRASA